MKRLTALLLLVAMLVSLAACAADPTTGPASEQGTQASTTVPTTDSTDAPTTPAPTDPTESVPADSTEPEHIHAWAEATCTAPKTCSTCGATEGEALEHSWDDGAIQKEATEDADGEALYTCTICGVTKIVVIPALGHEHEYTNVVVTEPTCTSGGYSTYTCRCGDSYRGNETAALSHNWQEATCLSAKTCSVCGNIEGDALGHDYVKGVCARCNEREPEPENLDEIFEDALDLLDMAYQGEFSAEYVLSEIMRNLGILGGEWDEEKQEIVYRKISADEFEARMYRLFEIDDTLLQSVRELALYNEAEGTYTLALDLGAGGFGVSRVYKGYQKNGDTYEVIFESVTYDYLRDHFEDIEAYQAFMEDYMNAGMYGEPIEYNGMIFDRMDGDGAPCRIASYDGYGKKYTVEYYGGIVRLLACADYEDLNKLFESYLAIAPLGHFEDAASLTAKKIFRWMRHLYVEGATYETIDRDVNPDPSIYEGEVFNVERYPIASVNEITMKYLGRTYDFSTVTFEDEEFYIDEENGCLVYIRPDYFITGGYDIVRTYAGYTTEDDTHYTIYYTYTEMGIDAGYEEPYVRIKKSISVEYVDGKYIVTGHRMDSYEEITEDEFWDSLV